MFFRRADFFLNGAWQRANSTAFFPLTQSCGVSTSVVNIAATQPGLSH